MIVTEFVTLDGVMEVSGGEPTHPHSGWVFDFMGDEQLEFKLQEVLEADAYLIGRVTYESFAGAWPERTGEFAASIRSAGRLRRQHVAIRLVARGHLRPVGP